MHKFPQELKWRL